MPDDLSGALHLLWTLSHEPATTNDGPPKSIPVIDSSPKLFALIIGIDEYKSLWVRDLRGAVADAKDVENYLKDDLKVHADQIRTLHNKEATRAAIIKALQDLPKDPRIQPDDPILIFFAGHGGEKNPPKEWGFQDNKIQYILPHDIKTQDEANNAIHGIPDRTLGTLLNELAKSKGDNISVIFDCCHSGSGTRTDEVEPERLARVVEIEDVPPELDMHIWNDEERCKDETRGAFLAPGFVRCGLRSHVLIAACGAEEKAREHCGRGIFTEALVKTLRSVGADKVTYQDVLKRIPALPSDQNPQCEGVNRDRILFNAKAPNSGRFFYTVSFDGGEFVMEAGTAHGLTDGAEFTIYKEQDMSSRLGVFATKKKEDLRLYVVPNDNLNGVFQALAQHMSSPDSSHRRILLVELDKDPHIMIDFKEGKIVFNTFNPLLTKYGFTRMPYSVDNNIDDIYPVIQAAAHFRWYLDVKNPSHILQNKVKVHFYQVHESGRTDDDFNTIYEDDGNDLHVDGEVYIGEDPSKFYAFKIFNESSLSLYPYLFYFNNNDFEILSFYQPPFGRYKVDVPLKPYSSFTIGYGSGGSIPVIFELPPGKDLDVGFLKLFLTTKIINYSEIPQGSAFPNNSSRAAQWAPVKPQAEIWDTIMIPVIQKRGHVNDSV
ncbi:hypothetical protein M422DRAFT_71496 [Sphaerobolus stellatus SS14]|uniref:Peptidase C14 caspase domain-containing protein n=1 Tax=Sphaerobolus stellatus (strain SS14) TaxID=990650 RepID=A0A0C9URW5_SPHS4|nr:hypothetical protein M422DRAFT_71496 [Sphaerobolus stellatus SS14]